MCTLCMCDNVCYIMYVCTYVFMYKVFVHRMGDKGELLVKTEIMCNGYYNNEAQSASSFADGWYVCIYYHYS